MRKLSFISAIVAVPVATALAEASLTDRIHTQVPF
jgi:hypothetical protein